MSSKGSSSAQNKPVLLKLTINSGGASPSPPVGPALGQRGVKAMDFCRQFNDLTKPLYLPSTPLRCHVTVMPDRTFTMTVSTPPTSWLLKRAAGLTKAVSAKTNAKIDARYVYEIARIKKKDPSNSHLDLRGVFRMIVAQARLIGIKVF